MMLVLSWLSGGMYPSVTLNPMRMRDMLDEIKMFAEYLVATFIILSAVVLDEPSRVHVLLDEQRSADKDVDLGPFCIHLDEVYVVSEVPPHIEGETGYEEHLASRWASCGVK